MIRLMLSDGTIKEVPEAEAASVEGESLVLRSGDGRVVLTMSRLAVTAYGQSEALDPSRTEGNGDQGRDLHA